ncbi:MAG TPA: hypothetical protein VGF44_10670 [Terriglobales bacterium]|jgi:hypothetical protein
MFQKKFLTYAICCAALAGLVLFIGRAQAELSSNPTVSFSLDFPGSDPSHYIIAVSNDGHSSYQSDGKLGRQDTPGDIEEFDFTLSPATTKQIFDLAKKAHYFEGQIDSKKKVASTGEKTLTFSDGTRNNKAAFNYSSVAAVQDLTRIFQGLSSTLEFGRRLQYCYHHEKLALNEQLTNMENAQRDHQLSDVTPILPILNEISKDQTVVNVARAKAMRLASTKGN